MPASRDLIVTRLAVVPQTIEAEATLDEAFLTMHESGVSCLAVLSEGLPVGVVSQRDILRARLSFEEDGAGVLAAEPPTVAGIVRTSPAIRPGQRLCEAAAAMIEHSLPAVTIVNQAGRLLGIVTEDDILLVMYDGSA
jgi:CBS domain-containing protein